MKKTFLYFIMSLFLITGCVNDDFSENSSILNLKAPNGEYIANNINDLSLEIEKIIASQYGEDIDFSIESIDYTPIAKGYLANVSYKTANGEVHNFIKTNNFEILMNSEINQLNIITEQGHKGLLEDDKYIIYNTSSRNANARNVSFVCKSASNCTPCKVEVGSAQPIEPGGPIGTKVKCTNNCVDCKLEATIIHP